MRAFVLAQENLGGGGGGGAPTPGAEGGVPAGAAEAPSPFQPLIFIGVMLVVFYLLLIRPQQKRAKKHKQLVESLKRGDQVITSSGIFGRIAALEGATLTIEIAKGTEIKVLRSHVAGLANQETEKELAQGASK